MMKINFVDPETLKSAAYNPRQITREELNKLIKSIKQFGFVDPALVRKHDNMIVGGHQRVKAALELGLKEIPVVYLDITENDAKLLNVALNKISGEWEEDKLTQLLAELKFFDDVDELLTGFDEDELDELLADLEEPKEGLTDDDAIPEEVETICKEGQLWKLGNHRLLCGDAINDKNVELLMDGNKADMVFTDPPYGYEYESNHQSTHKMLKNDNTILNFLPMANKYTTYQATLYLCTSHQVFEKWKELVTDFTYKNMIVWKKNNWSMGDLAGSFAGQHELILFASKGKPQIIGKRDTDIWSFDREPPKLHPTMKPVDLIIFALSKWQSGKVLDLFLGSGSTLIACEKTNRICYGMELDPHYCDIIIKRWEDYTGQKAELLNGSL
tara:strand:- start:624 stop:1781 length:1158 start_codon:yes stop_codon:yes gene_type:complete